MSHQGNDIWFENQMEQIRDEVCSIDTLNLRPDLLDDCIDFCLNKIEDYIELDRPNIRDWVIEFLVRHCNETAISSKDLEKMAEEYDETPAHFRYLTEGN